MSYRSTEKVPSAEHVDTPPSPSLDLEVGAHGHVKKIREDVANAVLAEAGNEAPIEELEERRLRRKIDRHLLPILCLTYAFQYADKAALSSAALFGIVQDLGLYEVVSTHPLKTTTKKLSDVGAIFSAGLMVGSLPLGALAQRLPRGRVCGLYVILWGLIALLTTTCTSYRGIMAQRFFLGILEGGIGPAFYPAMTTWYTKREHGFRNSFLNVSQTFAVVPATLIFFGCSYIGGGTHAWKYMYYAVGSLTLAWGFVVLMFMPDSPATARFLNHRERYVAVERLRSNQAGLINHKVKPRQFLDAILDPKVLLLCLIGFCVTAPNGLTSSFGGLVVKSLYGASNRRTLLLNMPAGVVGGTANLLVGYISMKVPNSRTICLVVVSAVSMIGCILCWRLPLTDKGGLLGGLYTIFFFSAAYGQTASIAATNVAGSSKKTAMVALVLMMVAASGIASPYYFKTDQAPRFTGGFKIIVIQLIVAVIASIAYGLLCWRENRVRNKEPIPTVDQAFSDLTDKENRAFRYVL